MVNTRGLWFVEVGMRGVKVREGVGAQQSWGFEKGQGLDTIKG